MGWARLVVQPLRRGSAPLHISGRPCLVNRPRRALGVQACGQVGPALQARCCAKERAELVESARGDDAVLETAEGSQDVCLYESKQDMEAVARSAYRKCQLGAFIGLLGFAGTGYGVLASAGSPVVLGMLGAMAAVNTYKQLVISKKHFARSAARHVSQLWLLEAGPDVGIDTPEVRLAVITANVELRLKLADIAPLEGDRYPGLVGDGRVPFGEAIRNSNLLHIELGTDSPSGEADEGTSSGCPSLLVELLDAPKVVVEQTAVVRQDCDGMLVEPTDSVAEDMEGIFREIGKKKDENVAAPGGGIFAKPADEIRREGTLSVVGGVMLFTAGSGFVFRAFVRESSDDPVSVRDVSFRDVLTKLKERVDAHARTGVNI